MTVVPDDADARLQRSRSIDWRFTLADPSPGRIVLSDGVPDEMRAALADAGWRSVEAEADVALIVHPTSRSLSTVLPAVRPGGAIHISWLGVPRRWRAAGQSAPRMAADRLRDAGFDGLRWYVLAPGSSGTEALVPLADASALDLFLRRRRAPWRSRPTRMLAELCRRTGLLVRLAPAIALTAQRTAAPSVEGRDAATAHLSSLAAAGTDVLGVRAFAAPLLLTPRFRASRHVVAIVPSPDMPGPPATIVKMSRLADDGEVTRREAAALARIAQGPLELGDAAPHLIDVGAPWGMPTLVETAVAGRPLDPVTVRRDPDRAITSVGAWLERLACLSGSSSPAGPRLDRLVGGPLADFGSGVASAGPDDRAVAATHDAIAALNGMTLPVAFEHGDASHPNLFLRDDGSVAAVDWECAEPDGLPAHDLTTLLAYVAVARSGAKHPADQGQVIAAALTDAAGWAPAVTRDHLARIGVDPDLARPLTLVALARMTMGLGQRLGGASAAGTVDFVRAHRYYVAWRGFALEEGITA
jgi:hypothetical protein